MLEYCINVPAGDAASTGLVSGLSGPMLAAPGSMQWSNVLPIFRHFGIIGSDLVGLPISSPGLLLLHYRADVLAHAEVPVPSTWEQLLQVVQGLNGTVDMDGDGQVDHALCLDLWSSCSTGSLLSAVFASMAQSQGESLCTH